ncbi:hypothetical protein EJ03DRAFT_332082 [Teratosphaeria nubilosa]|uniref:Lanthionine synthetase C-like protein n=1 Tax=Teratosphaeria nubilosa TaxID=161662 RepID=A0A6G1KUS9_9PEZI|nr:hypothetical protein EJ03DRAFT_332082 [Teratosphaeria nubilosa]
MPPRYFKNDAPLARRDPRRQLEASLTRLVTHFPPASITPGGGLFKGPVSVAYALLVLSQFYPDLTIADHNLGTWSAAYLKVAQDAFASYPGPRAGKCGVMDDVLSLLAIGAASSKDVDLVADLCDYSAEVLDAESENEWLYGRAGYLYLLRLVKASFLDDPKTLQLITDTQEDVIDAILESQRPWRWHGKVYIGAVHGAIGIITQVVMTNPQKYAAKLEAELAVLLTYQYDSGNFPSSVPPERDRLVQVCHGAPGVVISLLSIKEYFPNLKDKIDKAIAKGRECILERGLLTKEPCLCHGISGNALALGEKEFEHFLTYTTGHEMKSMEKDGMLEKSSAPESLFGGEAGRAWTWAVADRGGRKTLLGYNDL